MYVIAIDTGNCTGWAIYKVVDSPFSYELMSSGIVPIVPAAGGFFKILGFWTVLLSALPELCQVQICVEANFANTPGASQTYLSATKQVSIVAARIACEKQGFDVSTKMVYISSMAAAFGIKVPKTKQKRSVQQRRMLREYAASTLGLDTTALNKSLDTWDAIILGLAAIKMQYREKDETMKFVACRVCGEMLPIQAGYGMVCKCRSFGVRETLDKNVEVVVFESKSSGVICEFSSILKGAKTGDVLDGKIVPWSDVRTFDVRTETKERNAAKKKLAELEQNQSDVEVRQ